MVDSTSLDKDSSCHFLLPRGEMPKWFQPIEEGFVSFMASKDLYDKFLGLVFCVVRNNEGNHGFIEFVAHFNGERQGEGTTPFNKLDPGSILLSYFLPSDLWKVVHFGQIDGSYAQLSLTFLCKGIKKCGFRIICKQLDDDLKLMLQDNKLIDPAFLYEVGHDSTYSKYENSHMYEDSPIELDLPKNLQENSHMHENSPIEFDLDCPPNFDGRDSKSYGMTVTRYGNYFPENPRGKNRKWKLFLEE